MRLVITDPTAIVADHDDVVSVRAEDESGGFGVLEGHADLLTVLTVSVVSWRHSDGTAGFCAVRRGVLTVRGGREVAVATREAQPGDDLETLEASVLTRFRTNADAEQAGRTAAMRLQTQAMRRIIEALRPDHGREIGS